MSRNALELWNRNRRHDWDRIFDWVDPFVTQGQLSKGETKFVPDYGVEETDEAFLLSFDLPGVKLEDVKIEIEDSKLTLSGERKFERARKSYSERRYGSFKRSFQLPENIQTEEIEASFEDGVLNIALPKAEEKKPTKVEIRTQKQNLLKKLLGTKEED